MGPAHIFSYQEPTISSANNRKDFSEKRPQKRLENAFDILFSRWCMSVFLKRKKLQKPRAFGAFSMAPPVGLEPTTLRLTAACSTDWAKEECYYRPVLVGGNLCRRRLIFPGGCPPSIVSTSELNYRVRNGNGWTLIVIGTDSIFNAFNVKSIYILHRFRAVFFGDPYGIRTHVAGVRGRSLRPLDQRAVWYTFRDSNPGHPD